MCIQDNHKMQIFRILIDLNQRHDNDFSRTNVFVSTRKIKVIVLSKNVSGVIYYSSFNHKSITRWEKQKTFGWKEQVKQSRFESANGHMAVKS